jgi:hypothetical protein
MAKAMAKPPAAAALAKVKVTVATMMVIGSLHLLM